MQIKTEVMLNEDDIKRVIIRYLKNMYPLMNIAESSVRFSVRMVDHKPKFTGATVKVEVDRAVSLIKDTEK